MDIKDYNAIDNAIEQHYRTGKITEKCPKCGEFLVLSVKAASYEVKCKNGCIKEVFRGI